MIARNNLSQLQAIANTNEEIPTAPSRKEYSGQFNVRIDRRDHRALAIEAAQAGLSLNALVAQKLHQSVISQNESNSGAAI